MNRRQAARLAIFIACREWVRLRDLPDRALSIFRSFHDQPHRTENLLTKNLAQGMIGEGLLMVSWRLAPDGRTRWKGLVQQPGAKLEDEKISKREARARYFEDAQKKPIKCSWCGKKFTFPSDALKVTLLSGRGTRIHRTCFQPKEHFQ